MDNIFCIECGFELPSTAKFCLRCGDKIPEIVISDPEITKEENIESESKPITQTPIKTTPKTSESKAMGFLTSLKVCHTKYADFEGTASRSEYWWFYLYTWLLIPFCFIPYVQILFIIIALTTVIPYMAVAVRRMHDLNYSGWRILWGLIPLLGSILLIVWYSKEGNLNKDDEVKIEEEEEVKKDPSVQLPIDIFPHIKEELNQREIDEEKDDDDDDDDDGFPS